jgi:broad specificity phosphatase PhoE
VYAPEGGESYLDVARKLLWFLLDLADFAERKGFSKILLATHMGPLRVLSGLMDEATDPAEVLGRSFRNAELVKLEWTRLSVAPFLARFL